MATKLNRGAIDRVIRKNIKKLRKPGALTARPGYKITGGWITDKPAIVVTVEKKLRRLAPREMLPAQVDGVAVDVREVTGVQRLRASDPDAYSLAAAHMRSEYHEPQWPDERSVKTGEKISKGEAATKLHAATAAGAKKPQIPYTAPEHAPLDPVTVRTTIVACASPDDGYGVLSNFLAGVRSKLTIAMYDFTSGDILKEVKAAIGKTVPLKMVLDHPPLDDTANQTDEQTRTALLSGDHDAQINWALTQSDPVATEWIFPTSYHIKVAVRNHAQAFWLSSGNFNVSNEPNLAVGNPKRGSLATSDRDWHVVVDNPGLAALFETYIEHDFAVASSGQSAGNAALHKKIRGALNKLAAAQKKSAVKTKTPKGPPASTLGKRKTFENVELTIQPILTPDPGNHTSMYVDNVLQLLKSAKRSIYMQTQYVHPSDAVGDAHFMLLIQALASAYAKGLDVRIICSQYENTAQWLEKIKPYDLDKILRIQERVHNKGIIVDSSVVLVSSQNWSADGVLRNRDAGLILNDAEIAQYFEAIFLDDWSQRADQKLVSTESR
ncbi:MAG TPA: phospholipase D-like domain-containing protein [Candidatus Tumulicola sp.]